MPISHDTPAILAYAPLVRTWMKTLSLSPEDVEAVIIDTNVQRDYDREVREQSHWRMYRPGTQVSVTLHTHAGRVYTEHFACDAWKRQNEGEQELWA